MIKMIKFAAVTLAALFCSSTVMAQWAFEENFDGLDPASPSQSDLPATFDYTITHRTHPNEILNPFPSYRADHGNDCGPPVSITTGMHDVTTSQVSSSVAPDDSFYVCKNHMMSSLGDVSGYSVSSFWPRQEFEFINGGVLEFDVNITENPGRFWWEILITPRNQLTTAAAQSFLPIDETYPPSRIVLKWDARGKRSIGVGAGAIAPDGWLTDNIDWRNWRDVAPNDPALTDKRIRRKMRIRFTQNTITWQAQMADGTFDDFSATVPGGLPFERGLVLFKTHAYTPQKDNNFYHTTWHWDNIRFNGPVTGRYDVFETKQIAYLEANGDRPIGDSAELSITLPRVGSSPKLHGQIHAPTKGQVLLSINGSAPISVDPIKYGLNNCYSTGWSSIYLDIPPALLRQGENVFRWTVGNQQDGCAPDYNWDGFSVKDLEIQLDATGTPPPSGPPQVTIDIEAEDYRQGIQGDAWSDSTPGNHWGHYRNDDVDVGWAREASNRYVVSHIRPGEWIEYDTSVPRAGNYSLILRYADWNRTPRRVGVTIDGVSRGTMTLPVPAVRGDYRSHSLPGLFLTQGNHRIRLQFINAHYLLDRLQLVSE